MKNTDFTGFPRKSLLLLRVNVWSFKQGINNRYEVWLSHTQLLKRKMQRKTFGKQQYHSEDDKIIICITHKECGARRSSHLLKMSQRMWKANVHCQVKCLLIKLWKQRWLPLLFISGDIAPPGVWTALMPLPIIIYSVYAAEWQERIYPHNKDGS